VKQWRVRFALYGLGFLAFGAGIIWSISCLERPVSRWFMIPASLVVPSFMIGVVLLTHAATSRDRWPFC